ncbi:hypothetical protein [Sulfuricurvum sp.]|uniref:hypothetical protein n=1 Tax=Sulfuricurvum sp. TaxID=2025608 RepID=UPI00261D9C98|nr:hypothetical protein [Sulfuricurvum sp.]MDD2265240.1 hypothetical protein [Sulfuricurvum sp.]
MFISFLNRFISKKSQTIATVEESNAESVTLFQSIADKANGAFFEHFKLYHQNTVTPIDLLIFLPERGVYFGEKILWTVDELKGAQIERSSKRSNKSSTTQLENTERKIHQKLNDVLSFDSTPIERFFWMPYLSEDDFDSLDSSFHELLPKGRLLFKNESKDSIEEKLKSLAPSQTEPFSLIKVIGSLTSHTLLLPTEANSFGSLISEEQIQFLNTPINNSINLLSGDYGSGKSTVLLRKALLMLLDDPTQKIMIITPTKLGGELLRDELIELIDYAAVSVDIASLSFYTPAQKDSSDYKKSFQESTAILCDDTDHMEPDFIETLKKQKSSRYLVLCSVSDLPTSTSSAKLINHYRYNARHHLIQCTGQALLTTLLNSIRQRMETASLSHVLIVLPDFEAAKEYKKVIDDSLDISCQILTPSFSLQYRNLDDLILTTPECLSGISVPHLYLISLHENNDYPFILSRASETATIISLQNS